MIALAVSLLLASLIGSPHCAGMCGGFVFVVAGDQRSGRALLAYHVGRLLAYVALGAAAGTIGLGFDRVLAPAGLPHAAAIATGVLLVLAGGAGALAVAGVRVPHAAPPVWARAAIGAVIRAVRAWPPVARGGGIGVATALLPCGWLWAFLATAAGAGSALGGAATMAVFWLGTVPALAALGFATSRALGPLQRRLPLVTATMLVALGLFTIAGKLHAGRTDVHAVTGAACHVAR